MDSKLQKKSLTNINFNKIDVNENNKANYSSNLSYIIPIRYINYKKKQHLPFKKTKVIKNKIKYQDN